MSQDRAMRRRFLFITRNYPPQTGGLETYSYNLIKEFEANDITLKIVLTKPVIHLFWFLPYSFIKGLYIAWSHGIRSIHLCDGVLAPVGILLKFSTRAKISISIHGLDITYRNALYQKIIPWCVRRLDRVICVSRSTLDECKRRGIRFRQCVVIPNGIRPEELYIPGGRDELRRRLEQIVGVKLADKTVLVTVGRLVPRKGVAWFVENVMTLLDESYKYLVAGDGPEYGHIQHVIWQHNLQDRVWMLGRVSDEIRNVIYNAADIFIMPNITIPDDIEGFGIAAIEAGSRGLPVIASNLQGLRDAVLDGQTGYLVGEGDVNGFIKRIKQMDLIKENVRSTVSSTFNWKLIYQKYRDILIPLVTDDQPAFLKKNSG